MTATKTAPTQTAPAYVRISQVPGANLSIHSCRFIPDQAYGSMHLLQLLGSITGSCEAAGASGYTTRGKPEDWSTLADAGSAAIESVLRRTEAAHPGFRLEGGSAVTALDRVDQHFALAQARKRREG